MAKGGAFLSAQKELIKAMEIIAEKHTKNQTKVYNGRVLSIAGGKANVSVNGVEYLLPIYGSNELSGGSVVKVVLPDGNMSQAFVLSSSSGGGGGTTTIPIATTETLGGVIVGDNLNVDNTGKISLDTSSLDLDDYLAKDELLQTTGAITTNTMSQNAITNSLNGKVSTETGKGLSTNDFTNTLMTKLNGIATGAEVNVQADWSETITTDDSYIQNKPTALSSFTNDQGFITKTVNNLANYYLSSNTYTKSEVNNLVNTIPQFSIEIVTSLPTTGISTTTIYLVAKTGSTNDYYDEYIYVSGSWELLGSTQIDLSNYYTIAQVDSLLDNKQDNLTQTQLDNIADITNKLDNDGNASSTTSTFATATTRTNILSGETLSTLFGKISKWFTDLKTVAFTGSYSDLTNKPTIPTSLPPSGSAGGGLSGTFPNPSVIKWAQTDTRGVNENPEWYMTNNNSGSICEFKYNPGIGLSTNTTYSKVITYSPWHDSSGGYPVQVASNPEGLYYRVGTSNTSWSNWGYIYSTTNPPSYNDLLDKPTIPEGVVVVDSLSSTSTNASLSANQGRVLNTTKMALRPVNIEFLPPSTSAGYGGYLDFHYNQSSADYTSRIIEDGSGKISISSPNGFEVNGKSPLYQGDMPSIIVSSTQPTAQETGDFWYQIV